MIIIALAKSYYTFIIDFINTDNKENVLIKILKMIVNIMTKQYQIILTLFLIE